MLHRKELEDFVKLQLGKWKKMVDDVGIHGIRACVTAVGGQLI